MGKKIKKQKEKDKKTLRGLDTCCSHLQFVFSVQVRDD